jgi:hypothetical protein
LYDFYNKNDEGMWQRGAVNAREVLVNNAERTQEKILAVEGNIKRMGGKMSEKLLRWKEISKSLMIR